MKKSQPKAHKSILDGKTPFKDFGFGSAVHPKKHYASKAKVAKMKKM